MKYFKQLFHNKYRNRIENRIRELEIDLLKVKMDRTTSYSRNPSEYAKSLSKQDRIIDNIVMLKSLI